MRHRPSCGCDLCKSLTISKVPSTPRGPLSPESGSLLFHLLIQGQSRDCGPGPRGHEHRRVTFPTEEPKPEVPSVWIPLLLGPSLLTAWHECPYQPCQPRWEPREAGSVLADCYQHPPETRVQHGVSMDLDAYAARPSAIINAEKGLKVRLLEGPMSCLSFGRG